MIQCVSPEVSKEIKAGVSLQGVREGEHEGWGVKEKTSEQELQDQGKGFWERVQLSMSLYTGFSPKLTQVGKGQWEPDSTVWVERSSLAVHLLFRGRRRRTETLRRKEDCLPSSNLIKQEVRGLTHSFIYSDLRRILKIPMAETWGMWIGSVRWVRRFSDAQWSTTFSLETDSAISAYPLNFSKLKSYCPSPTPEISTCGQLL